MAKPESIGRCLIQTRPLPSTSACKRRAGGPLAALRHFRAADLGRPRSVPRPATSVRRRTAEQRDARAAGKQAQRVSQARRDSRPSPPPVRALASSEEPFTRAKPRRERIQYRHSRRVRRHRLEAGTRLCAHPLVGTSMPLHVEATVLDRLWTRRGPGEGCSELICRAGGGGTRFTLR